jgi:hypothetical protein
MSCDEAVMASIVPSVVFIHVLCAADNRIRWGTRPPAPNLIQIGEVMSISHYPGIVLGIPIRERLGRRRHRSAPARCLQRRETRRSPPVRRGDHCPDPQDDRPTLDRRHCHRSAEAGVPEPEPGSRRRAVPVRRWREAVRAAEPDRGLLQPVGGGHGSLRGCFLLQQHHRGRTVTRRSVFRR